MHTEDSLPPAPCPPHALPPALTTDVDGLAVFLDIDGTLLDIAETPDAIVVPHGLPTALGRFAEKLEGALALVTGRPLEMVDRLFPDLPIAVAGLHGAERRDASGKITSIQTTPAFAAAKSRLRDQVAQWPGVVFEDKGAAFAAHFRLAPGMKNSAWTLMAELARSVGDDWVLQEGKQVVELRPRGSDKGDALLEFMKLDAFAGRTPLAIGDDVTDEAMFAAANGLGGRSILVAENDRPSMATQRVSSPSLIRAWIERIAS